MFLACVFGLSFAFVGAVPHMDEELLRKHARLIREALRLADLSIEKACLYMHISKSQFVNQLNGIGHLSYTRLCLLPLEFWRWMGVLIAEDDGLPHRIFRAGSLQKAILGRRSQLVMSIRETQEDTRKAV